MSDVPSVHLLEEELATVADWPSLGLLLRVSKPKIDEIKDKFEDVSDVCQRKCKRQLFEIWVTSDPSATWEQIIEALERIGNNTLATRLKAKHIWRKRSQAPSDINDDLQVLDRLQKLEDHFTDMVVAIKQRYIRHSEMEKIKRHLATVFRSHHIDSCESYDELFKALRKRHLDAFNIHALEVINGVRFDDEVSRRIDEFTSAKEKFFSETSVYMFERAICCRKVPACPNGQIPLVVKLPTEAAKNKTMKNMEELVRRVWGKDARYLAQCYAQHGPVTISWFFPESLTDQLRDSAIINKQLLHDGMVEGVQIAGIYISSKDVDEGHSSVDEQIIAKMGTLLKMKNATREDILRAAYTKMVNGILNSARSGLQQAVITHLESHPPTSNLAKSMELMLKKPLLVIPVTGQKGSGKTTLVNAMLGDSFLNKGNKFPVYIEHDPTLHLHCDNPNPCKFCPRLVSSSGIVLAQGRQNILMRCIQGALMEGDGFFIIQTNIPMFDFLPEDYPLTICLVDCPADSLHQLKQDTEKFHCIIPTLVYAFDVQTFFGEPPEDTNKLFQDVMGAATLRETSYVNLAATFSEEYYTRVETSLPEMSEATLIQKIESTLSTVAFGRCQSRTFLVADKWALRTRQFQCRPEDRLQLAVEQAWYWILSVKGLPKRNLDSKELLQYTIGHLEKSIQRIVKKIDLIMWANCIKQQCDDLCRQVETVGKAAQVASRKKEQQLLAELDTLRRMHRDKDQQILSLKEELQAKHAKMTLPSDLFEQQEKEMLEQKGVQVTSKKDQQLQGRMYCDKDQQILRLKEELQAKQVKMTSPSDVFEQRENEMLEQKAVQVANKKKEQQLEGRLDTMTHLSHDKDQQILMLEPELQGKQVERILLSDQFEQSEKKIPEQKVDIAVQVTGKEMDQQLQTELDTAKHMSRAKDLEISKLEQELQELQKLVQVTSKKEQLVHNVHAELKAVRHMSRVKDQQITILERELHEQKALHTQSVEDTGVQADYLAIAPGTLRGVEVCGETVLEVVGDKSQKVEWPGYGFNLEVPDRALPPGVTASVAVKAILAGQFQLPEDSQLISAIYWISASEVFQEDVAVNIQHCAVIRSEEECSKFRFIIAKCSQKKLPYRFREKEGVLNPHTHYATIKLKQFSLVGVTAPEGTENHYIAYQFYDHIPSSVNVNFIFTIFRHLKPVLEYVKEKYQQWKPGLSQAVYFEDDAITLDLPDTSPVVVNGWSIFPATPPQITKAEVDHFEPKLEIPYCVLHLQWTGGDEVKPLLHRVTLKGAKSPKDYFYICYYSQAIGGREQTRASSGGEVSSPTSSSTTPLVHAVTTTQDHGDPSRILSGQELVGARTNGERPSPPSPMPASTASSPLVKNVATNLVSSSGRRQKKEPFSLSSPPSGMAFLNKVVAVIPAKWRVFAYNLGFEDDTLEAIERKNHDTIECFMNVFWAWKKNMSPPFTWGTVIEVLQSPSVGGKKIADDIRQAHDL